MMTDAELTQHANAAREQQLKLNPWMREWTERNKAPARPIIASEAYQNRMSVLVNSETGMRETIPGRDFVRD